MKSFAILLLGVCVVSLLHSSHCVFVISIYNSCPVQTTTVTDRDQCRTVVLGALFDAAERVGCGNETVDVCAIDQGACFADQDGVSDCHFNTTNAFVTCTCPPGYEESPGLMANDRVPGTDCTDIDECSDPAFHNCATHGGVCMNIPGSFECSCDSGYSGDGFDCEQIANECLVPVEPICDPNALCTPLLAGFCITGVSFTQIYNFNDASMTHELCQETCVDMGTAFSVLPNSTDCACVDMIAIDIIDDSMCRQCAGDNTQLCGVSNTDPLYVLRNGPLHSCMCDFGYSGNGTTCVDADICGCDGSQSGCIQHGPGEFTCLCATSEFLIPSELGCETFVNRSCAVDAEAAAVTEFWPATNCDFVYIADNCSTTDPTGQEVLVVGLLHTTAICNVGIGLEPAAGLNAMLFSRSTFESQANALLDPVLSCGEDSVSIALDRFVLNELGWTAADLALGGMTSMASCRGRWWYGSGSARYLFESALFSEDCGVTFARNDDIITYTLVVTGSLGVDDPSSPITRTRTLRVEGICTYNRTSRAQVVPSEFFIYNNRRKRDLAMETENFMIGDNQYDITMSLWTDEQYSQQYDDDNTLNVPDWLFADITLDYPDTEFQRNFIQLMRCWIKPVDESMKYLTFLDNGCDIQSGYEVVGEVKVLRNNELNSARIAFPLKSFKGGLETIAVECLVNICDRTKQQNCVESCLSRSGDGNNFHFDMYVRAVSVNTIKVNDVCGGASNGGCYQYCSVDSATGQAACSCQNGFKLDENDVTKCIPANGYSAARESSSTVIAWYYYVPAIIVLVLLVAIFAIWRAGSKRSRSGHFKFPEHDEADASQNFLT